MGAQLKVQGEFLFLGGQTGGLLTENGCDPHETRCFTCQGQPSPGGRRWAGAARRGGYHPRRGLLLTHGGGVTLPWYAWILTLPGLIFVVAVIQEIIVWITGDESKRIM